MRSNILSRVHPIVLLFVLTLSCLTIPAAIADEWPIPEAGIAQTPQTMSPGQWRALSETTALNLARAGIPSPYIRSLTQEYLRAFQQALMLGATMPDAQFMASQHIEAEVQQALAAARGAGPLTRGDVVQDYARSQQRYGQTNKILNDMAR